jgi:hypothetical protein
MVHQFASSPSKGIAKTHALPLLVRGPCTWSWGGGSDQRPTGCCMHEHMLCHVRVSPKHMTIVEIPRWRHSIALSSDKEKSSQRGHRRRAIVLQETILRQVQSNCVDTGGGQLRWCLAVDTNKPFAPYMWALPVFKHLRMTKPSIGSYSVFVHTLDVFRAGNTHAMRDTKQVLYESVGYADRPAPSESIPDSIACLTIVSKLTNMPAMTEAVI